MSFPNTNGEVFASLANANATTNVDRTNEIVFEATSLVAVFIKGKSTCDYSIGSFQSQSHWGVDVTKRVICAKSLSRSNLRNTSLVRSLARVMRCVNVFNTQNEPCKGYFTNCSPTVTVKHALQE